MALWGTVQTLREQLINIPRFALALDYLEKVQTAGTAEHARVMAVPAGEMRRVEIAEGVFALEQAYLGKPRADGRWEAHNGHIDLQAILAGPERMDVTGRAGMTVNEDRLATDDVCFMDDVDDPSVWTVRSGEVAVFFPSDAHMPSLAVGEPVQIKKTCVKVAI
jgi:biofilm protein TabA